ncbi:hypothetical protein JKP88DRAFT_336224 [Tribonema minus]|uniref:peptidylprolyl isomerase n=1 Tax=Tribonema minus TaxID=303371 RepID=A0A835YKN3_9STRA|nr:hypothetical protein JKP88DRAFT_336224 [Tribonema minus]
MRILARACLLAVCLRYSKAFNIITPRCAIDGTSRRDLLKVATVALPGALAAVIADPRAAAAAQTSAGGLASFESVSTQTPLSGKDQAPLGDVPFTTLPSGVKIKDYRSGSGAEVKKGSRVWVQATGRMLNLNGVKFFSTKDNVVDPLVGPEPLVLTIGDGSTIPGLEEGILGMKKGGIRRIVVPAAQGYKVGTPFQPAPRSKIDQNALDSVVKNPRRDSTTLWDVQVERVR